MKYQIVNKYGYTVDVHFRTDEVDAAYLDKYHAAFEAFEINAHGIYGVTATCKGVYWRKFCKRYELVDTVLEGAQFLEHHLSPQYAY